MWLAGGLAVVAAGVVLVALAFLEDDSRRTPRPRRRGTITADELRSVELPVAWRGYDRGHVEALLARAARTLDEVRRYGEAGAGPVGVGDVVAQGEAERPATPAVPPSFLAGQLGPSGPQPEDGSGEELEDGRGEDAGGLDR